MAVIDSRSRGILRPVESTGTEPPEIAVRKWMAGITSIPLELVRKRWVSKPGTQPAINVDWVAVGVDRIKTHGTPYQRGRRGDIEKPESGDVVRESHQTLSFVASFYGPNAALIADGFREGALLGQNAAELARSGLVIQGVGDEVLHLPDFAFEQWIDRYDVTFTVGRKVTRTFGVRDFAAVGEINIHTEKGML